MIKIIYLLINTLFMYSKTFFQNLRNLSDLLEIRQTDVNVFEIIFKENIENVFIRYTHVYNAKKSYFTIKINYYNQKYKSEVYQFYLLRLFFQGMLMIPLNNYRIMNFPSNKQNWEKMFNYMNSSYGKRLNISKIVHRDDLITVIINIKKTTRNHIIPQMFLKKFALKDKSDEYVIYIFDKKDKELLINQNTHKFKINSIEYQHHYFSEFVEQRFSKYIENPANPILQSILSKESLNGLTISNKAILLKFLFSLYVRSSITRKWLENLAETQLENILGVKAKINPLLLAQQFENLITNFIFQPKDIFLKIYEKYLKMEWKLLVFQENSLITSDQPILFISRNQKNEYISPNFDSENDVDYYTSYTKGKVSLLNESVSLYCPLSPKCCIVIHQKNDSPIITFNELLTEIISQHNRYLYMNSDLTSEISPILENPELEINIDDFEIIVSKLE